MLLVCSYLLKFNSNGGFRGGWTGDRPYYRKVVQNWKQRQLSDKENWSATGLCPIHLLFGFGGFVPLTFRQGLRHWTSLEPGPRPPNTQSPFKCGIRQCEVDCKCTMNFLSVWHEFQLHYFFLDKNIARNNGWNDMPWYRQPAAPYFHSCVASPGDYVWKKNIQVTFRSIGGHRKWARFLSVDSSDHSSKVLRSSAWAGQTDRQTDRQCRCDKPIRVFCRRCVVRISQASTPAGGWGHIPRIYYAGIYPYGKIRNI